EGNSVLMIPGTGLGTAAILFPEYSGSQSRPVIIGSEIQHACVATLDAADAPMLDKIASYMGRDRLSWEDIVSGRGLVNIFTYLTNEANANSSKVKSVPGLWAGEIAEHAVQKYDVNCISALNIYYRYAGALAQLLALCYQPLGGIYLAGESTSKNVSFIKQGHFLDELHHSATQREGLQSYPVYLIADEINLQGAAYLASLHLNSNEPKSFFA
ncbi:MAG: glucokinase, partial [Gammaproteobacteria bacterium]